MYSYTVLGHFENNYFLSVAPEIIFKLLLHIIVIFVVVFLSRGITDPLNPSCSAALKTARCRAPPARCRSKDSDCYSNNTSLQQRLTMHKQSQIQIRTQ